jgi:hypothetical protein
MGMREPAIVAPSRSKLTNWLSWEGNSVRSRAYRWRGFLYDSFALSSNGCGGRCTGPLVRILDRFRIWKRFWEGIDTGYNTGTEFYSTALFVNPWMANTTNRSPQPQIIGLQATLTDYWTYFESENGFEKVLPLATILVQVLPDQSYSLTPQGPIHTKSPAQIIGPICPLDKLLDRFWIWKRFSEGIAIGYKTGTGFYRTKLFVNPSSINTQKVSISDNRAYRPPGPTNGPISNLKTVLRR